MDNNEYISIKEFATKAGISQQAVYKQLNNRLKQHVKQINGKKYVHISALKEYQKAADSNGEQQIMNMLQSNIKILQEELSTKNNQIAELQKLLDQEQQLRMVEHKKLAEIEEKQEEEHIARQQELEADKNRSIWGKIFKK